MASSNAGGAEALQALRSAIEEVDPTISVWSASTIENHVATTLLGRRIAATLLLSAAAIALVLTLVGIFGSVSYAASRRSYEMAIRLSLGARPREVTGMMVRSMLRVVGIGATLGLAISIGGSRLLDSMLYGVGPLDPISFVLATGLLAGGAVLAAFLPARRAGRTELTTLLKEG